MTLRVLPYGDRALLVELGSTDRVVGYVDALRSAAVAEVDEVVPAAETVLVVGAPGTSMAELRGALLELQPRPLTDARPGTAEMDVVEITVRYDGPDLSAVAEMTGLTERDVVAAHTGQLWRVAFGGFAPGFGYLVGEDQRLHVPRRESARTAVPPGAVGLAGEYSGVYPRESPGGWQLIGTTDAVLWDLDRDPPALLRAGAAVRFVEDPS